MESHHSWVHPPSLDCLLCCEDRLDLKKDTSSGAEHLIRSHLVDYAPALDRSKGSPAVGVRDQMSLCVLEGPDLTVGVGTLSVVHHAVEHSNSGDPLLSVLAERSRVVGIS